MSRIGIGSFKFFTDKNLILKLSKEKKKEFFKNIVEGKAHYNIFSIFFYDEDLDENHA